MPRILIADDDEDVVELIGIAMAAAGLETGKAHSLPAAARALQDGAYDAVVLDMGMEGSETGAPAKKLRDASGKSPKILMLTGRDLRREREKGTLEGADAVLEKTCSLDLVVSTVKKLLETSPS